MSFGLQPTSSWVSLCHQSKHEPENDWPNQVTMSTSPQLPSLEDILKVSQTKQKNKIRDHVDCSENVFGAVSVGSSNDTSLPSLANILSITEPNPEISAMFNDKQLNQQDELNLPSLSVLCFNSPNKSDARDGEDPNIVVNNDSVLPSLADLMRISSQKTAKCFHVVDSVSGPLEELSLSELADNHFAEENVSNSTAVPPLSLSKNSSFARSSDSNLQSSQKIIWRRKNRLKCQPSKFSSVVSVRTKTHIQSSITRSFIRRFENQSIMKNMSKCEVRTISPVDLFIFRETLKYSSLKKIFLFDTPSPDDIVRQHQEKSFKRGGSKE